MHSNLSSRASSVDRDLIMLPRSCSLTTVLSVGTCFNAPPYRQYWLPCARLWAMLHNVRVELQDIRTVMVQEVPETAHPAVPGQAHAHAAQNRGAGGCARAY